MAAVITAREYDDPRSADPVSRRPVEERHRVGRAGAGAAAASVCRFCWLRARPENRRIPGSAPRSRSPDLRFERGSGIEAEMARSGILTLTFFTLATSCVRLGGYARRLALRFQRRLQRRQLSPLPGNVSPIEAPARAATVTARNRLPHSRARKRRVASTLRPVSVLQRLPGHCVDGLCQCLRPCAVEERRYVDQPASLWAV